MKLEELAKKVTGITYDSRAVKKGGCFVAVCGAHADGHKFINDAVKNGAVAIVSEQTVKVPSSVTNVVVTDTHIALAELSAAFFGYPSRKIRVVGITGTNGKTTITYLIEAVLKVAGRNVGVVGTVNWRYGGVLMPAPNTTPMSYDLQRLLNEMVKGGVQDVAMEVSSHALHQKRVDFVDFDAAVFTNLTHDHLDYHKTIEEYFEAKKGLFSSLLPSSVKAKKIAVVNIDDGWGREIVRSSECGVRSVEALKYGFDKDADVTVTNLKSSVAGNEMEIKTPWGKFSCTSRLKGKFNVSNILASVAVLGAFEIPLDVIKLGIEAIANVPGRLEDVPNNRGFSVFVDYAHTPDALKNVIEALRELKLQRIITVFGCGGDRDSAKRPLMGEVASLLSDVVIVTSDNPRGEDPVNIINDILPGVKKTGRDYIIAEDRREAIKKAVGMAKKGDIILIAGKGHETYQIVGKETRHF
ncbi:MAG: UDP-N-acetylmuramoyl-L-alanyl-D-glutamate--2,6-diaminopimelate ligase, partial [Deltaproteobacteria bacterium RIFCSPLOWO2_02_FULL_47_10]